MSSPRPLEAQMLSMAEDVLDNFARDFPGAQTEARLQALEAVAARLGGFELGAYQKAFRRQPVVKRKVLELIGCEIVVAIERSGISPALAVSALAREQLQEQKQRTTGAYHTDFRLAQRLAKMLAPRLGLGSCVVDPACGAGILLVALTIEVCGSDRKKTGEWLRSSVFAVDLSETSLRSALIALSCLTADLDALVAMRQRWLACDSLMADPKVWQTMAPGGFDAVIANPPWEKIKATRHEFLRAKGEKRHYGASIDLVDHGAFARQRQSASSYARLLGERYPVVGQGEPDLYMAFLSLHCDLLRQGGCAAILAPGGLIRSQGAGALRAKIWDETSELSVSVLDNKARFFSIDTRFKFLAVCLTRRPALGAAVRATPICLTHEKGTPTGTEVTGRARIRRRTLLALRPDLSLPEVRSDREWSLFERLCSSRARMDQPESPWAVDFAREVDMTTDRRSFSRTAGEGLIPLVEGRMVHQHRFGVKGHVNGEGRAAIWRSFAMGGSTIRPQFFFPLDHCTRKTAHRLRMERAGFCDIAGQTNERSMTAALIPARVVCGNKVPTILFPNDPSRERLLVWIAVVNSFAFDWMVRRVLTTTINYFVLLGLPLPELVKGGLPWRRIVRHTEELIRLDTAGATPANWSRMAWLRAQLDAEVSIAYGLDFDDLRLLLSDFPLLDRAQPPLVAEQKSTVTTDLLLATASKRLRVDARDNPSVERARIAAEVGAFAYQPSEIRTDSDAGEATLYG
jgi:hypothetical protein